jgi:DNA-binding NarL/FixJ family response regulator
VENRTPERVGMCHHEVMPMTVLIVDDHPSFRANARALLEAEGFEVVGEAEDAASAIEAFEKLGPQLILLDVQLPDGDGFDVARRLSSNGHTPSIVLVSSRDRTDFGSLVEEAPVLGFIPKADLSGQAIAQLLP